MNIYIQLPFWGGIGLVILYVLKKPEVIDKWSNIFYRFAFWIGKKREKRILSTDIDYRVTVAARKINNEEDGILPFGIRIKWQNPKNVESFVQKGNVIIILKKDENIDRNIVDACRAYLPQALLPKARTVVDSDILTSVDYHMVKRILSSGNYTSAYNYFVSNVMDVEIRKNYRLRRYIDDLSKIDARGFLTRILLKEFKSLGDLLFGTSEEAKYKGETRDFIQFIYDVSSRATGDDTTKLYFIGKKIKIGIIFVAKRATLVQWGINAYLRRIDNYRKLGIERVFILSYTQIQDESVLSREGYVMYVKRYKKFIALTQIEAECKKLSYMRLIKKQRYYSKDSQDKLRSAKYYVYQLM